MTLVPVAEDHYAIYNARMAAGIEDKLFFQDRLDVDVIVDYGCANGTLLRHLRDRNPGMPLLGFDASQTELDLAQRVVPSAALFSDWDALTQHLRDHHPGQRIALIASSVVHEVYAYGGQEEGDEFWTRLAEGPFTHFVLRDMALSKRDKYGYSAELGHQLRTGPAAREAADYESLWASLDNRWHAAHFLLKYRYTDNWQHELSELYLPLTGEEILERITPDFEIEMVSHEVLPFLQAKAEEELGLSFPCPTHVKIIARRKGI